MKTILAVDTTANDLREIEGIMKVLVTAENSSSLSLSSSTS